MAIIGLVVAIALLTLRLIIEIVKATTIGLLDAMKMPTFLLVPILGVLISAATAGAINMSTGDLLKLIPYESLVGLSMTIVSTIMWVIIM